MKPIIPVSFMTRNELEELLGPASDYIYQPSDLSLLRTWAQTIGRSEPEAAIMSAVALTNLYHAKAGQHNDLGAGETLNDMFVRIVEALSVPGFNIDLTRHVALDTMRG